MIPNEQLTGLGLTLPPLPEPRATFAPWVKTGSLLFLSGAIGTQYTNGRWSLPYKGKVGTDLDIATAKASARLCALNHLAAIDAAVGLDRVEQVVKLSGHVYCGRDFTKGPLVLDGASELFRNRPIATALHFVVDGVRTLRDVVIDVVTDVNRLKPLSVVQRWLGAASSSTAGVRAVCCSYGR